MTAHPLDFNLGFESSADRITGERAARLEAAKRQLPYGHAFLDDCLRSIMPNDLIVIGARTGVGKTELARGIATHNAKRGKRVRYFALEAEPREIERRTKYGVIASLLVQHRVSLDHPFNYPDWYRGRFDAQLGDLEDEADEWIQVNLRTLQTYYRGRHFDRDDVTKIVLAEQDNADLIVLDHLHYVDIDDDNENRGMRDLVMAIRNTAIDAGLPVILVVHLRKKATGSKSLVPSTDDIHGSSEIAKVCTHTIMLEPANGVPIRKGYNNTFVTVPKDRGDGAKSLLALCAWDWRRKSYENSYTLGRDVKGTFEPITRDEAPFWAARHEGMATESDFS